MAARQWTEEQQAKKAAVIHITSLDMVPPVQKGKGKATRLMDFMIASCGKYFCKAG